MIPRPLSAVRRFHPPGTSNDVPRGVVTNCRPEPARAASSTSRPPPLVARRRPSEGVDDPKLAADPCSPRAASMRVFAAGVVDAAGESYLCSAASKAPLGYAGVWLSDAKAMAATAPSMRKGKVRVGHRLIERQRIGAYSAAASRASKLSTARRSRSVRATQGFPPENDSASPSRTSLTGTISSGSRTSS